MNFHRIAAVAATALLSLTSVATGRAAEGDSVWQFAAGGAIFGSPARDGNGNLFFGSRDGKVYSLDAQGQLRWSFAAGDWVDSSPTLSLDETAVYFGSWDNRLYAVSAASGTLLWSFETGSLIVASPALDTAGNLFFGSADGFFYSLSAQGSLRWSYLVGSEMDSSPAVAADGSVYVAAYDGSLYAFSNQGALKWLFATAVAADPANQRIKAPPTVDADGTIYIGGGNGDVYAVSSSGEELWRFAALEPVDTGVAVGAGGSLVFGSRDGYLYSLDRFGVLNWESYVGDVFYSTPAVDEFGRIYVGVYLGNGVSGVTVLSMDGALQWDSLTLDYIDSSPLLGADGRLYFGSYDGILHSVEAYAAPAASAWNRFGGDRSQRSLQKPAAGLLTVSPQFSAWLQSYGLYGETAELDFDADGDGWGVLLEYWLGGDPAVAEASLVEVASWDEAAGTVSLRYNRPKLESTLQLGLQYSLDLREWQWVDSDQFGSVERIENADATGDGLYETVLLTLALTDRTRVFLRAAALLF